VSIRLFGPIMDGAGLNITALSHDENVTFGITACSDLVSDVWEVAEAIPVALSDLLEASGSVASAALSV
jgi:diacylglycerol O-acyltransferase / wax synthase